MKILRFFEDKSVEIKPGKLTNRAIVVNDVEAYKIDTQSIGFYNPAKLFGYLPSKIYQIITTRHPDSAPLRPLVDDYLNPNPVTAKELQEYEDQFFLEEQLKIEQNIGRPKDNIEKLLIFCVGLLTVLFVIIAIFKALPVMKENYTKTFNKSEVTNEINIK